MQIYLGADHGGYQLKEEFKVYLSQKHPELSVQDRGAFVLDPADDYPPIALAVAKQVASEAGQVAGGGKQTEDKLGILLCRSGSGMVFAANKVDGIRAVELYSAKIAAHAKNHNHANVIAFSGDYLSLAEMIELFETFLSTPLDLDQRHQRRIEQISNYEQNREK